MRYFLLALLSLFLVACDTNSAAQVLRMQGATMGTQYHIAWVGVDKSQIPALQALVDQRLQAINKSMSTYDPTSELSRLNKADLTPDPQGWVSISTDLSDVLSKSLDVWNLSGGKFDVTVGPLVNLWGFGPTAKVDEPPSAEEIAKVLINIGSQNIELERSAHQIKLKTPQYIDLSAIAKGWGVDEIAALLESQGITAYMVEIGGEIRTRGQKPDGKLWRIAIERPSDNLEQQVALVIEPGDMGVATSGSYRNYFEEEGVRYSHTIDPATGYPITHKLVSITVLHPECALADAWATALDVIGPKEGLALAEQYQLAVYMLVSEDGQFKELASSEFNKRFPHALGEGN